MTGADIIGVLLRAYDPLVQMVPAERIKAGSLGDNVALPALLVRTVSVVDRQSLKRIGAVRRTDRVSVTVRAASYRDQVEAIRLVRECCAGKTGDIAGASGVSILTAGTGPDLSGPANSFEQAQDFRTSFNEPVSAAAPDPSTPGDVP